MGDKDFWWKRIKTKDKRVLSAWRRIERSAFEYELARRVTKRKDVPGFLDLTSKAASEVLRHFGHDKPLVFEDLQSGGWVVGEELSERLSFARSLAEWVKHYPGYSRPLLVAWNLNASDRELQTRFIDLINRERHLQNIGHRPKVNKGASRNRGSHPSDRISWRQIELLEDETKLSSSERSIKSKMLRLAKSLQPALNHLLGSFWGIELCRRLTKGTAPVDTHWNSAALFQENGPKEFNGFAGLWHSPKVTDFRERPPLRAFWSGHGDVIQ